MPKTGYLIKTVKGVKVIRKKPTIDSNAHRRALVRLHRALSKHEAGETIKRAPTKANKLQRLQNK